MLFQRKVDRAMRLQKEENDRIDREHLPEDTDKIQLEKKDTWAMILSAWLVFMPIAIVILLGIAFGAYFLFVH